MQAKRVKDSRVTISHVVLPTDANPRGYVHGGVIMKLVDEVGGIAAARHARCPVVTVAIDSVTFLSPVYVGNLLTFTATLTYVGRTSMEVHVRVEAEDVLTGEKTHTNSAYAVYVALDKDGRPCEVPRLIAEMEEEKRRMAEGRARQEHRLRRKARENGAE
ncbi:MAG: acyl-CoA thioesterase [Anaerolineae bacterium]